MIYVFYLWVHWHPPLWPNPCMRLWGWASSVLWSYSMSTPLGLGGVTWKDTWDFQETTKPMLMPTASTPPLDPKWGWGQGSTVSVVHENNHFLPLLSSSWILWPTNFYVSSSLTPSCLCWGTTDSSVKSGELSLPTPPSLWHWGRLRRSCILFLILSQNDGFLMINLVTAREMLSAFLCLCETETKCIHFLLLLGLEWAGRDHRNLKGQPVLISWEQLDSCAVRMGLWSVPSWISCFVVN